MEIGVAELRPIESRAPRCAEAVACPRIAIRVAQDSAFRFFRAASVEHDFQRCADRDHNSLFLFSASLLVRLQPYVCAVVLRPSDVDQRPLTLAGPEREQQRKLQFWRCHRTERRNMLRQPNDFRAIGFV